MLLIKAHRLFITHIKNLKLNSIPEPEEGLSALFKSSFWESRIDMWGTRPGNLAFDYGMRTANFARGIDEPEAKYLLELLNKRGISVYTSDKI